MIIKIATMIANNPLRKKNKRKNTPKAETIPKMESNILDEVFVILHLQCFIYILADLYKIPKRASFGGLKYLVMFAPVSD